MPPLITTGTPQIDPRIAMLAKLFLGTGNVQPGPTTFPQTGADAAAQTAGAQPGPGMTQQPKLVAADPSGNPAGMTQPKPAAAAPNPAGMTQPAPAGSVSRPGPTAGGLPQPTGAKKEAVGTTEEGFPSESAWTAAHPTPQQQPYVEPDLKHRMLMGLFAGMQNVGQPGSGSEVMQQYMNRIYQGEDRNRTAPADQAAAAHQAYMTAVEGAKGPLSIENMQQQLADRRAAAQRVKPGPTLAQQYADAIESGDQAGAEKALTAIKAQSGASAKPIIETLAQRYADAVDAGDQPKADKYLEAIRAQSKAQVKPVAPKVPTSEGGMAYADWRRENPNAPISNYFKLKNAPKDEAATEKNLDSLRKERETVQKDFEARITGITTSPQDVTRLRTEEEQQLAVFDRQIHNFQAGYREGDVIPYKDGHVKITRINPDGTLQVQAVPEK